MPRYIVTLLTLFGIAGCVHPPTTIEITGRNTYPALLEAWLYGRDAVRSLAVTTAQQNPNIVVEGKASVDALFERLVSTANESQIASPQAFETYVREDLTPYSRNEVEFYRLLAPSFDEHAAILVAYQNGVTKRARDLASKRDAEAKRLAEVQDAEAKRVADERIAEEKRLAEQRRLHDLIGRLAEAQVQAAWLCKGAICEKAFSLAQIFVDQYSDMKIQIATNTIVETYSPTEAGKIGLKVIKIPLKGDQAEVRMTVACKAVAGRADLCLERELATYLLYPLFMKQRLAP